MLNLVVFVCLFVCKPYIPTTLFWQKAPNLKLAKRAHGDSANSLVNWKNAKEMLCTWHVGWEQLLHGWQDVQASRLPRWLYFTSLRILQVYQICGWRTITLHQSIGKDCIMWTFSSPMSCWMHGMLQTKQQFSSCGNFEGKISFCWWDGTIMPLLFYEFENAFQWTGAGPNGNRGDLAHRIVPMLPGDKKCCQVIKKMLKISVQLMR